MTESVRDESDTQILAARTGLRRGGKMLAESPLSLVGRVVVAATMSLSTELRGVILLSARRLGGWV